MISYSTRAVLLATAFAVSALAATPSADAASFDGPWSVLVITKSGACDQSYRYGLMIRGSSVSYLGGGAVSVSGSRVAERPRQCERLGQRPKRGRSWTAVRRPRQRNVARPGSVGIAARASGARRRADVARLQSTEIHAVRKSRGQE